MAEKELLEKNKVYLTDTVREWKEVVRDPNFHEAMCGRLFAIMGKKGDELKADSKNVKYKARGVFAGNAVQTKTGTAAHELLHRGFELSAHDGQCESGDGGSCRQGLGRHGPRRGGRVPAVQHPRQEPPHMLGSATEGMVAKHLVRPRWSTAVQRSSRTARSRAIRSPRVGGSLGATPSEHPARTRMVSDRRSARRVEARRVGHDHRGLRRRLAHGRS